MWKKLQEAAQHPAVQFVKKICGDPVQLYIVLLMTSIMQYYHSSLNWLYTIITVFLSYAVLKFYDFVAKHRFVGPLVYLAYLFLGLCGVSLVTTQGMSAYPISFGVWFLTPQSVVEFSIWYTLAIYLLMLGFLSSAVYYFAKVRYRMVMQFLIMLIPLSLYAKEGIQMPALLVIVLLSSYFLLMVYCRQLREDSDVRRLHSLQGSMSVACYVLAFSILAAVVPKPKVEADRTFIENAMSYSALSDILMDAIGMFTESTDNSVSLSNTQRTVYFVNAQEPLRLRTQSYTYYLENDSWNAVEEYDLPSQNFSSLTLYQPRALLQAILDAAAADGEFAGDYGLTQFTATTLPAQESRMMLVVPNFSGGRVLPAPTRFESFSKTNNALVSAHGAFTPITGGYSRYEQLYMTYYSETYAHDSSVSSILSMLRADTYSALLLDAAAILEENDPEASALLTQCHTEQADAMAFLAACEAQDFQSDVVDALAAELTAGLDSDYEKARAIERYFTEMGFVYDMDYQKAEGENVEDFLTQSKRGVCYEYATAMVLLCRSAGLPARYMQGYNMTERSDVRFPDFQTNYQVKIRDAHGFPEVYISGYGWLSFEPTVTSEGSLYTDTAENYYVMIWGFVLLGLCGLAAMLYFLMPMLREKYFRRRLAKLPPHAAASAVFRRMRKVMHLADSTTVMAIADMSEAFGGNLIEMQAFFANLDLLLYSSEVRTDVTTVQLTEAYVQWQTDRHAYEKAQKRKEKELRKMRRKARS